MPLVHIIGVLFNLADHEDAQMIEIRTTEKQQEINETLKVLRSLRRTCNITPINDALDNAVSIIEDWAIGHREKNIIHPAKTVVKAQKTESEI